MFPSKKLTLEGVEFTARSLTWAEHQAFKANPDKPGADVLPIVWPEQQDAIGKLSVPAAYSLAKAVWDLTNGETVVPN